MLEEGSQYICLSVVLNECIFETGKHYYLQVFLEECKYVLKEKKVSKYIIENIEISSNEENSDGKNSNDENSDDSYKSTLKKLAPCKLFFYLELHAMVYQKFSWQH